MKKEKEVEKMSDHELEQEMRERKSWDSRYFELEREIESRD